MPVKGTLSDNGLLPSSSLLIVFRVLLYQLWYILRAAARLSALIKLLYCKLNRDACVSLKGYISF